MSENSNFPKFAIMTLGKFSYVFLYGKCISAGLEDVKFSARDEKGELHPTAELKIDIQKFSLDDGMTFDYFVAKAAELNREISQAPPDA